MVSHPTEESVTRRHRVTCHGGFISGFESGWQQHFAEFACTLRQDTFVRHCYQLALGLNEQGTGLRGNDGDGSNSSKVGGSYPCWVLQDNIVKST